ncbi:BRCA1-associated protein [Trichonephila clavipes]|nr:BRCA1-associated protein [Trichonephila clavipes]
MNQNDCISDDSSEQNSEDVVLPDEIDVFVVNEDEEGGINDATENYHTHLEEEYANYRKPPDGADITAKRNRRSTAADLSRQLSSATGTTVSRQTVYRRLGHIGLYARRPVRCVPLTATHCHLRLTWSREYALWAPQQWSCVMFSVESRFSLQSDSRRTLIWRAPGTR